MRELANSKVRRIDEQVTDWVPTFRTLRIENCLRLFDVNVFDTIAANFTIANETPSLYVGNIELLYVRKLNLYIICTLQAANICFN